MLTLSREKNIFDINTHQLCHHGSIVLSPDLIFSTEWVALAELVLPVHNNLYWYQLGRYQLL